MLNGLIELVLPNPLKHTEWESTGKMALCLQLGKAKCSKGS